MRHLNMNLVDEATCLYKCVFSSQCVASAAAGGEVDLRLLTFLSHTLCLCLCVGQMKGCIKVLKEQPSNSVEGLLNALRCVWTSAFRSQRKTWLDAQGFRHISLCRLLLQVYDTASKWRQHLQTNQSPPAMRTRRTVERGRKERRGGKKKRRKKQTPVADKAVCLHRTKKSSPGCEKPADNKKRKLIIYILSAVHHSVSHFVK